jgi:hypothetical protein
MALTGNHGEFLTSIRCGAFTSNPDVVTLDTKNNQVIGGIARGMTLKHIIVPDAPENCPLTIDITSRKLGDFAVCNECVYATLVSEPATKN